MTKKTLKVVISTLTLIFILTGCAKVQEAPIEIPEEPVETAVETPVETPVADEEKPEETVEEIVEEPVEEIVEEKVEETPASPVKETFTIKNMTGKSLTDAKSALSIFNLKVVEEHSDSVGKGLVISQNPKSGEKEKGIEVEVRVSLGKKPVAVVPKPTPTPTPAPTTPKPALTPKPAPQPVIKTYEDVKTESIAFKTEEREDNTLELGQTRVIQEGTNGVKTYKYQVTTTDGKETSKKLISEAVTRQPVNRIIVKGTQKAETWQDRVERQVPAGFTVDHTSGMGVILKNGEYVGFIGYMGLRMNKSLGRANHEMLADFWIVYRKEFGLSTNRTDLFNAIGRYYEDGNFADIGKIQQTSSSEELALRHY